MAKIVEFMESFKLDWSTPTMEKIPFDETEYGTGFGDDGDGWDDPNCPYPIS